MTRRRVLGGLAAVGLVGAAGCGEPATEEGSPDGGGSPVGGDGESPAGGDTTPIGEEDTTPVDEETEMETETAMGTGTS